MSVLSVAAYAAKVLRTLHALCNCARAAKTPVKDGIHATVLTTIGVGQDNIETI